MKRYGIVAARLIGGVFWMSLNAGVLAETLPDNVVAFDYAPASQWDVPLPNDLFTAPNAQMLTQRRVNLPLPADENLVSERKDVESVNVLDGFSIFPRITIPLTGSIPDVDSFTTAHVFLVALSPGEERGRVIGIDQRIIDDSSLGAPRLIFAPDEYLREQSRYAIVVTAGLTGAGVPFRANPTFLQLIDRYRQGIPPTGIYQAMLYDAMDAIVGGGIASTDEVVTLSVFTTRTVSDVPLKLMRQLQEGQFPVQPAQFDIDGVAGLEVIRAADILNIDTYVHRASIISDGSAVVAFPPNTLRVQDAEVAGGEDLTDEVYVENARTAMNLRVPDAAIDRVGGSITGLDVAGLEPLAGDELAVLVRKRRITPISRPYFWGALEVIAFGKVDVPRYTDSTGLIPSIQTGPDFVPPQTGTDRVVIALFLPKTPSPQPAVAAVASPAQGWPVVHLLHGGAESRSSFLSSDVLATAPILASRGLATVAFTAAEFDGGPRSRVQVRTQAGIKSITGAGRAIDVDGNGVYEQTELYVYPQRVSDVATILRSIQLGVDLNADGLPDVAQVAERTSVAGVSFGGATAFIAAALEPNASLFLANVPTAEGSRARGAGFHPLVAPRGRVLAQEKMAERIPPLLNGPSPTWGGEFNEDIPLKRQPVQVGLASGAEAIQRAFDVNMWRDLESMPLAYARQVGSGALRGGPAPILVQVSRGDGAAVNPIQALMVRTGQLQASTAAIRPDHEPLFDQQWGQAMAPELARHVLAALPYAPSKPSLEVGGRICHYTRVQIAEYLRSQGAVVTDPDDSGTVFTGDVFQFPVSAQLLDEMIVDPGIPSIPAPPAQTGGAGALRRR